MDVLPVFLGFLGIVASLHGWLSFVPLSRADFSVLVSPLEGLQESEVFSNISSNWSIVDGDVSKDTLVINDVGGSEGEFFSRDEASISLRD